MKTSMHYLISMFVLLYIATTINSGEAQGHFMQALKETMYFIIILQDIQLQTST